ncbi:MAG: hypothetical protein EDR02_15585 [Actinobacteria bacterium]|nr:MAG: hypothetical protein EDR02_15585 [Actinomycetota bacterium]RIK03188.1 MAG: hypothetical protein DCC48_16885 [Acidobacteriota bacterium]
MSHPGDMQIRTVMFTDIVASTDLLDRLGDERSEAVIFQHREILCDGVAAQGGEVIDWLGDGIVAVFTSTRSAASAALAICEEVDTAPGPQLQVRIGLSVGDVRIRHDGTLFGSTVVMAKRLCDLADAGQILATETVRGVLAGQHDFVLQSVGELDLKGFSDPVACVTLSGSERPARVQRLGRLVNRNKELSILHDCLEQALQGRGAVCLISGEAGIGKTRLVEELARDAPSEVLASTGHCYEDDSHAYRPWSDLLAGLLPRMEPSALRSTAVAAGPVITRLVPALSRVVSADETSTPVDPDEDHFRLLDRVARFVEGACRHKPLILTLEDLHWADPGSLALFRHLARGISLRRALLIGTVRSEQVGLSEPVQQMLRGLQREAEPARVALDGLNASDSRELLEHLIRGALANDTAILLYEQAHGNPFFMRELLADLVESGAVERTEGEMRHTGSSPDLPGAVKDVIHHRIERLPDPARRLVDMMSVHSGPVPLAAVVSAVGIEEAEALDALDVALATTILEPASEPDCYDFTHAIVRRGAAAAINPSRQIRLQRSLAESLSSLGEPLRGRFAASAAHLYHSSRSLGSSDEGVGLAILAADQATEVSAHASEAEMCRIAMDLTADEVQRSRLLARRALAATWALADDATELLLEASRSMEEAVSRDECAEFLADALHAARRSGLPAGTLKAIADNGGRLTESPSKLWALFAFWQWMYGEESSDFPGIHPDTRELAEITSLLDRRTEAEVRRWPIARVPGGDRQAVLDSGIPEHLVFFAGAYQLAKPLLEMEAEDFDRHGQLREALKADVALLRCHAALGEFEAARQARDRARQRAARLPPLSDATLQLAGAEDDYRRAMGWTLPGAAIEGLKALVASGQDTWALASMRALLAAALAEAGEADGALETLALVLPAIEGANARASTYLHLVWHAVDTLWQLDRPDHADFLEVNVRTKVVEPDFRAPMTDGRLELARIATLLRDADASAEWFDRARHHLDETGERPLRAILDVDDALARIRLHKDAEAAHRLARCAYERFSDLEMSGWQDRVVEQFPRVAE